MVSSTLCPAVHILGSQNVYSRAEGIADHYWPWAVFLLLFAFYKSLPRNRAIKLKNRPINTLSLLVIKGYTASDLRSDFFSIPPPFSKGTF